MGVLMRPPEVRAVKVDLRAELLQFRAMQNSGSLKGFLNGQMPNALELLRQMVNINSFTGNREGVNRLSRFTAE